MVLGPVSRSVVVCLAAVLQLAASAPLDLNLCIAEDGHAGLEVAHGDGKCLSEVTRHHPHQGAFAEADLDHHPCRDLSLETDECGPGSSSPRPLPPALVSSPALAAPLVGLSAPVVTGESARYPPEEARIRTTVLLI